MSLVRNAGAFTFPFIPLQCTGRNGAISGTPSTYAERIIASRLDADVDLVMLEYAVNNHVDHTTIEYEDASLASYQSIHSYSSVLFGAPALL